MGERQAKMVIKTETCSYSGLKIWPGRGKTYVRMDQKSFRFGDGKAEACHLMKRRNLTTRWTAHYRRINKKGIAAEESTRRRKTKKSTAVRRDITGLNMELVAKAKASRASKSNSSAKEIAQRNLKDRKGAKK